MRSNELELKKSTRNDLLETKSQKRYGNKSGENKMEKKNSAFMSPVGVCWTLSQNKFGS